MIVEVRKVRDGETPPVRGTPQTYSFTGLESMPQFLAPRKISETSHLTLPLSRNNRSRVKEELTAAQAAAIEQAAEDARLKRLEDLRSKNIIRKIDPNTESMKILKAQSLSEDTRTVMHDLVTPHRSFVFPNKTVGRSQKWQEKADGAIQQQEETVARLRQSPVPGLKDERYRELLQARTKARARSVAAACRRHTSKDITGRKYYMGNSAVYSRASHNQRGAINELTGAFQNPDNYAAPRVKNMATFEEYLERTVNTGRPQPIHFHPSGIKIRRRQFRVERGKQRSMSAEPDDEGAFQAITKQLADKAERSATSLGFAPSREVVEMHRNRPPWFVDPGMFIRAYTNPRALQTSMDGSNSSDHHLADDKERNGGGAVSSSNEWFLEVST